jgi:hypothetical protein
MSPSVGEPGYLPYCGCCTTFIRCVRDEDGFRCPITGKKGRTVNGIDMFEETAPDGPGYDWEAHRARAKDTQP